ncbi:alpha/beta fold hydrolase [Pseudoduganella umbonata]|uniref:Alpha/beta hydrolase n=1 Tax=Pseudoduganella umbonata TaxID=864828 RepID=A0A4P8HV58_9BURK|nr:alpha/beta hydrolase [Pseudoduganella umbonata]MBB3223155.1 pimeloyl-ACP methyl ester carboxylesterase [Pseudoduganella umbonata]QCP13907.1 alpha/beta hydrolase [Pseudoduganella umbonata]
MKRYRSIAAVAAALFATLPAHAVSAFKADVTGSGPAVILIPGLASSGEVWQGTVRHLCGPRQCHVLTLAGFAGQPAIEGELLPQVERQLADYIATNKLGKPLVIGHSLGGFVAMKLAASHPDLVSKLVIVDALPALGATQVPGITADQLQQMASATRERMLASDDTSYAASQRRAVMTMASKPEDVDRIAGWGQRSDRKAVAGAMYALMAEDLRNEVARIKAPTLVLGTWVAYKDYAPRGAIEQVYKAQYARLPGVRVEMADTARHFIMYDDPAWMYDRIDQFLK